MVLCSITSYHQLCCWSKNKWDDKSSANILACGYKHRYIARTRAIINSLGHIEDTEILESRKFIFQRFYINLTLILSYYVHKVIVKNSSILCQQ